jgi:hypothetical protein
MYTGNSMAFVRREFIGFRQAILRNLTRSSSNSDTDTLGLNAYPMVDGFISKYKNSSYAAFVNSQTCAAHLINATSFEFLVARSIMNVNQDKGLPERLYEKFQTHFNYKIIVHSSPTELFHLKNIYTGKLEYDYNFRSDE